MNVFGRKLRTEQGDAQAAAQGDGVHTASIDSIVLISAITTAGRPGTIIDSLLIHCFVTLPTLCYYNSNILLNVQIQCVFILAHVLLKSTFTSALP